MKFGGSSMMGKRIPLVRFTLFAVMLSAMLVAGCSEPPYTNVSNDELKALMEKGVPLIDIRTSREWRQTGVVPGSHKITFFEENGRVNPKFFKRLEAIIKDPAEPVAIICRTGNRTSALGKILVKEMGYQTVYNVERGITNWVGSRLPITKG